MSSSNARKSDESARNSGAGSSVSFDGLQSGALHSTCTGVEESQRRRDDERKRDDERRKREAEKVRRRREGQAVSEGLSIGL